MAIDPEIQAAQLKSLLIEQAIARIRDIETDPERRAVGIEGVETCRQLEQPEDFDTVLAMRHATERQMVLQNASAYWGYRAATVEIERIRDRLRLAWNGRHLSLDAVQFFARRLNGLL